MKKFLIFALVALSAGLEQSTQAEKEEEHFEEDDEEDTEEDDGEDDEEDGEEVDGEDDEKSDEDYDAKDVESGLEDLFNLTDEVLKKECNVDFQSAWPTIGAALDKLKKFSDAFEAEAAQYFKEDDPRYEEVFQAICQKSEDFKNARMDIIKAALPCALEDRLSELMKISQVNTC